MFLKTAGHLGILINTISKREIQYSSELKCVIRPFCLLRSFSTSSQNNNHTHSGINGMYTIKSEN